MNDQELARALRAAVNVNHSPEFLARVRGRVAVEQMPRWPPRWPFVLAGATMSAVAIVAAIVAWPAGEHPAPVQPHVIVSDPAPPPPAIRDPRSAIRDPRSGRNASVRRRPPAASPFPEVLISPEDARAFDLLVTSARAHRIPELPTDSVSARHEVTLPRIEVPHVIIEPLPEIARLEGDRP
jgi:hypothetical protein